MNRGYRRRTTCSLSAGHDVARVDRNGSNMNWAEHRGVHVARVVGCVGAVRGCREAVHRKRISVRSQVSRLAHTVLYAQEHSSCRLNNVVSVLV